MIKNLKNKIRKNIQIFGLIFLIAITVVLTSYFNFKKNNDIQAYSKRWPSLRSITVQKSVAEAILRARAEKESWSKWT